MIRGPKAGELMEVYEAIQARKSIRAYDERPIPKEQLNRILESGRIAPSASNLQPWHFIVVTDQKKREILSEGKWAKFLVESPVVIVGCADMSRSPKWAVVDVTIAMQQMVIAATGEGLGTCWIGSFSEESVKNALKVPDGFKVVAMLTLGYPRDKIDIASKLARSRSRRPFEEVFSKEEF